MKNYSFLSYAHKDWEQIKPYYLILTNNGYEIWYDERIAPGTEWVETIAENLKAASSCLLFLSPDALASANVRREIHYAIANHIPTIVIMLKPCKLSEGLKLELSECCFVYPDDYSSFDDCTRAIMGFIHEADSEANAKRKSKNPLRSRSFLRNILFMLSGALLAAICMGMIYLTGMNGLKDVENADYLTSVAAFAKEYYEIVNEGGEDNYRLLWDEYLSDKTKKSGIITEEEWIERNRRKVDDHDYHIISYEVLSAETLPKDCFMFKSRIRFEADDEEYTEENREYLIIEDGEYRYLPDGVLNVQHFKGGETDIKGISLENIEMTQYINRWLLKFDIKNTTGYAVSLNSESNMHVMIIDTTEGSYSDQVDELLFLENGQSKHVETQIYLASGTPIKVYLRAIKVRELGKNISASLKLLATA